MGKSRLLIGALITAFALSFSADLADAHGGKHKSKSWHPTTAAQCAKKWKSYNPITMDYFGKDGKFHKCP
jgi:hypothetical protein